MSELIALNELAKAVEKPVMTVFRMAQKAKAICTSPTDENIYIDVTTFEKYLDNIINEEIKLINNQI